MRMMTVLMLLCTLFWGTLGFFIGRNFTLIKKTMYLTYAVFEGKVPIDLTWESDIAQNPLRAGRKLKVYYYDIPCTELPYLICFQTENEWVMIKLQQEELNYRR